MKNICEDRDTNHTLLSLAVITQTYPDGRGSVSAAIRFGADVVGGGAELPAADGDATTDTTYINVIMINKAFFKISSIKHSMLSR